MSRDRLREIRTQNAGGAVAGYGNVPTQSYESVPTPGYDAPTAGVASAVGQQDSYAMQPVGVQGQGPIDQKAFFGEVAAIQDAIKLFQTNIVQISDLHARRVASAEDQGAEAQLTQLTQQTNALTNSIRNRITRINDDNKKRSPPGDAGFNARKLQIGNLQTSFRTTLEEYNLSEKRNRDKYRQRIERQFRIVKPDASQDEVEAVLHADRSSQQIFTNALMQSRQADARVAYAEVQSRNQDLRKIEETMAQLGQMMADMATLILEQDEAVKQVEDNTQTAEHDMEQGLKQAKRATLLARAARKKRWICFWLLVIVIIVVVIAVVVPVTRN